MTLCEVVWDCFPRFPGDRLTSLLAMTFFALFKVIRDCFAQFHLLAMTEKMDSRFRGNDMRKSREWQKENIPLNDNALDLNFAPWPFGQFAFFNFFYYSGFNHLLVLILYFPLWLLCHLNLGVNRNLLNYSGSMNRTPTF